MSVRLSAGASFTPSPVMATVSLGPEGVNDVQLGLGVAARHDQLRCVAQEGIDLFLGHRLDLRAGDHPRRAAHDADPAGHRLRRETVVTGDHDDPDARLQAPGDRLGDVGARRILQARKAQECERRFRLVAFFVWPWVRELSLREAEDAQALSCVALERPAHALALFFRQGPVGTVGAAHGRAAP
jgi:hypothetical protein